MVPDKMVGLIIGRGGEQITRLQAESGCKIQMASDNQGLPERKCTLTGTGQAINDARAAIERIISNEGNGPPRQSFGGGGGAGGPPVGGTNFEMMVPGHKVGLIIGKGGETIKQLQEQSGAKIVIIQDTPEAANEKPLRITGTAENVEQAKQLVLDIVSQGDVRHLCVSEQTMIRITVLSFIFLRRIATWSMAAVEAEVACEEDAAVLWVAAEDAVVVAGASADPDNGVALQEAAITAVR